VPSDDGLSTTGERRSNAAARKAGQPGSGSTVSLPDGYPSPASCTPGPTSASTPEPEGGAQCVDAHAGIRAGGRRRRRSLPRSWEQLDPWLELRTRLPVGPLFCVLRGPTRGRPCGPAGIRAELHRAAAAAGVRRRFAPHQLRHAHAVEMSREGIPLLVIQRQLGHADLAVTSTYLRGIDNTEIIHAVYERSVPMIPASPRLAPAR
jgi:Phage integrase family